MSRLHRQTVERRTVDTVTPVDPDIALMGADYRRFLTAASWLARLPEQMAYRCAAAAGRIAGPWRRRRDRVCRSIGAAGIPCDRATFWRQRSDDQAAACVNLFRHPQWNVRWMQRHVTMQGDPLRNIFPPGRGGLFLTYHHPFHHSLFCLLGLAGFRVQVLAAPEESSPFFGEIGAFIRLLHSNCTLHFNGGRYHFITDGKEALRTTEAVLRAGDLLCSLNDFSGNERKGERGLCRLFGRGIYPPSGSIRVAQRLGVPIAAGAVVRDGTSYRLECRRLDETMPHMALLQAYFDYLAELLAIHPDLWDGWDWFTLLRDLPPAKETGVP
jgi:hypothetical protein